MKRFTYLIITILFFYQCNKVNRSSNKCGNIIEINELDRLKVKDTLLGFSATTDYKQSFNFDALNGKFIFLLFRNTHNMKGYSVLLNEEVKSKELGAKVISKGGNLIVSNEAKLLKLYGIEPNKKIKLSDNVLIMADSNKVISKIYKNACEDDIINILGNIKTLPNKK